MSARSLLGGKTGLLAATQHAALVALSGLKIHVSHDSSCALEASHRVGLAELDIDSSDIGRATSQAAVLAVTAEIHRLVPRFGAALRHEIGDGWQVRLRPRAHRLAIETPLPRRLSKTVSLSGMRAVGLAVEIGARSDGGRALIDLAAAPHLFIGGSNNCGKTALARGMLATLARHNDPTDLVIAVLDPKARLCHGPLLALPHYPFAPARTEADTGAALVWLRERVAERAALSPAAVDRLPRVVAFIDEAWAVLGSGAHELVRQAREYGVHLVVISQVVSAKDIDARISSQLVARIIGRVATADWRTASAIVGDRAPLSLAGRGDMFSPALGRFQAAYAGPDDPWWASAEWSSLATALPAPASTLADPTPTVNAPVASGGIPLPIRAWLLLESKANPSGGVKLPGQGAIIARVKALTGTGVNSAIARDWQRQVAAELEPALSEVTQ